MWSITIKQIIFGIPVGDNPAPNLLLVIFWFAFGITFSVFMLWICRLIIEVRSDGIYIRFVPFHRGYKSFLFEDIISYKLIVYNSLKRFGGWGVRFNAKGVKAYNISGKQGVEIQFKNNTVSYYPIQPLLLNKINLAEESIQGSDDSYFFHGGLCFKVLQLLY